MHISTNVKRMQMNTVVCMSLYRLAYCECTLYTYFLAAYIICSAVWYMWLLVCNSFSIILQVTLPTMITERFGHSAAIFGTGPDFRVVVLFGGFRASGIFHIISETTLLLLCKY